jgi:hypothetical protein
MPAIRFQAKPYTIGSWTVLRLPDDASAQLPSRGQVMVKGTINDLDFQAALEPDGNGSHWLDIDHDMQEAAKIGVGDSVTLAIEPTKDWPEPDIPADWLIHLDKNPRLRLMWGRITPLARWEWLRWIGSSGRPETRQRHIEVAGSKLLAGERRPCCFNRNMCCVPRVSKNGVLLGPSETSKRK